MSYSVELADPVVKRIANWNLSSHLQREILKGLDELGSSPIRHLVRVPEPADTLEYELCVRDPDDPGGGFLFLFSAVYHADEETLLIYDCDFLRVEPDDH
jgi:hypothetical protein